MARVHHVKANKDYPEHGIKKGEMYYWWAFRFGGKRYSKTAPRPSQLTQSDFTSRQLELGERLDDLVVPDDLGSAGEELAADVRSVAEEIRDLGAEQEEKLNNMPEGLQESETGQLLQGRFDSCESWADELESAADDPPDREEDEDDEDYRTRLQEWLGEVQACEYQGE